MQSKGREISQLRLPGGGNLRSTTCERSGADRKTPEEVESAPLSSPPESGTGTRELERLETPGSPIGTKKSTINRAPSDDCVPELDMVEDVCPTDNLASARSADRNTPEEGESDPLPNPELHENSTNTRELEGALTINSNSLTERLETPDSPMAQSEDMQEQSDPETKAIDIKTLKYIDDYKLVKNSSRKYFELHYHLEDGSHGWAPEAEVQLVHNAAVCTFWDTQKNGRPNKEVDPELLRIIQRKRKGLWVQLVGYPLLRPRVEPAIREWMKEKEVKVHFQIEPTYMPENVVRNKWPSQYDRWVKSGRPVPKLTDLQIVFGNLPGPPYVYSLLHSHKAENKWISESNVLELNRPALFTYMASDKKLGRRIKNIPLNPTDRRLRKRNRTSY
jgi:hypothetical protein